MLVVFVAADLVGGLGAQLDHVKGVKAHLASGTALVIAFSYPALMSIETARIEAFCSSVSPSKNACKLAALRPGAAHTIPPVSWLATHVRNL